MSYEQMKNIRIYGTSHTFMKAQQHGVRRGISNPQDGVNEFGACKYHQGRS